MTPPDDPKKRGLFMSDAERATIGSRVRANTPAKGVPMEAAPNSPWHQEDTGVHTDAQVFRALKELHGEIEQNKLEAANAHGALKHEVVSLNKRIDGLEGKLDDVNTVALLTAGKIDVLLEDRRARSPSGEMRAAAKETLAEQVLAEQRSASDHRRAVKLKLIGGIIAVLTSGVVLGAIVQGLRS